MLRTAHKNKEVRTYVRHRLRGLAREERHGDHTHGPDVRGRAGRAAKEELGGSDVTGAADLRTVAQPRLHAEARAHVTNSRLIL